MVELSGKLFVSYKSIFVLELLPIWRGERLRRDWKGVLNSCQLMGMRAVMRYSLLTLCLLVIFVALSMAFYLNDQSHKRRIAELEFRVGMTEGAWSARMETVVEAEISDVPLHVKMQLVASVLDPHIPIAVIAQQHLEKITKKKSNIELVDACSQFRAAEFWSGVIYQQIGCGP